MGICGVKKGPAMLPVKKSVSCHFPSSQSSPLCCLLCVTGSLQQVHCDSYLWEVGFLYPGTQFNFLRGHRNNYWESNLFSLKNKCGSSALLQGGRLGGEKGSVEGKGALLEGRELAAPVSAGDKW